MYKEKAKISVIIPCYNMEEYLPHCLDSILGQTFGTEYLQIVCVDDASTDNTAEVLKDYNAGYPGVFTIVLCDKNGKQGTARNIGMTYVSAEYVTFVDADDILHPQMLEVLYEKAYNFQADITQCGFDSFSDMAAISDCIVDLEHSRDAFYCITSDIEKRDFLLRYGMLTGPFRRLFRTDFLLENDIFFPENVPMEDIYFTWISFALCRSFYETPLPLYHYYVNPFGTMHNTDISNYMYMHHVSVAAMDRIFDLGLWGILKTEFEYLWFEKVVYLCIFMRELPVFPEAEYRMIRDFADTVFPDLRENLYLTEQDKENARICGLCSSGKEGYSG